ncbi:DUF664 domain-containing protein [Geodermatophilus sp. SYSU D00708]
MLLAELDGLDECAVRRPTTPTGTNLLGLVEHVAYVQLGYLGDVFGRPAGRPCPWDDGGEDDADMWATADQTREEVVELARHAGHADIVRELVDGAVGMSPENADLPERGAAEWAAFRDRVEQAARQAAGRQGAAPTGAAPRGAAPGDG